MDYAEILAVAQELIADAGRSVTVNRFRQAPADANKPWRGPTDPSTVPDATATVLAAFVNPSKKDRDDDLLKRAEMVCYVAGGASFDLATANEVVDGAVHWRVTGVETVRPGATVLLYIIGLGR